jgi:hypothetical protein
MFDVQLKVEEVEARATGRGTREAGSAGNCESRHEADNSMFDGSSRVEEAEVRALTTRNVVGRGVDRFKGIGELNGH